MLGGGGRPPEAGTYKSSGSLSGKKGSSQHTRLTLRHRLGQNLFLKVVSLVASVMLHFYVQGERNPSTTRLFFAPVVRQNLPDNMEVESEIQQEEVHVTGPRSVLDVLKDGDIRVIADLRGIPVDKDTSEKVPVRYDVMGVPPDQLVDLTFDPLRPQRIVMQFYPQKAVELPIAIRSPKEGPVGYHYGRAELLPKRVQVAGRLDRVKSIDQLVVNVRPTQPGGAIDADFPVVPLDTGNNPVPGITLNPTTVHVIVPLVEEPYSKIVSVSPVINDQPLPTYRLEDVMVKPDQARISGRPPLINSISTLETEPISVHDLMENQTISVKLIAPSGVMIRDLSGKPINQVTVHFTVRRVVPPSVTPNTPGNTAPPPQ